MRHPAPLHAARCSLARSSGLVASWGRLATLLVVALFVTACATVSRGPAPALDGSALWVVGSFANNTETPLAGNRAEAITEAFLRSQGLRRVTRAPGTAGESLFAPAGKAAADAALTFARAQNARYLVTGSVDEWRYKVGVDGEPAVGLSVNVVDVASGETVWSGVGGKSGWSREALAAVAQQLLGDVFKPVLAALQS